MSSGGLGKAIGLGAIAAIGCAIAWAAIIVLAKAEVGYVALGVGFLVGLSVRFGAGAETGPGPGVIAVILASLAVVGGKYAGSSYLIDQAMGDFALPEYVADDMVLRFADDIAKEKTAANEKLAWPEGMTAEDAEELADYPPEVVSEARKKWDAMPADEQKKMLADATAETEAFMREFRGAMKENAFKESFSAYDILWFVLCAVTAFRMGSGATSD